MAKRSSRDKRPHLPTAYRWANKPALNTITQAAPNIPKAVTHPRLKIGKSTLKQHHQDNIDHHKDKKSPQRFSLMRMAKIHSRPTANSKYVRQHRTLEKFFDKTLRMKMANPDYILMPKRASRQQLQRSIIINNDYQLTSMDKIPNLHCEDNDNDPCYRLDIERQQKIYYACNAYYYCHEGNEEPVALATINELQHGTLAGKDNNSTLFGRTNNFICKHVPDICYQLDDNTHEKIYYTCILEQCEEIRVSNNEHHHLKPADNNEKIPMPRFPHRIARMRRHSAISAADHNEDVTVSITLILIWLCMALKAAY